MSQHNHPEAESSLKPDHDEGHAHERDHEHEHEGCAHHHENPDIYVISPSGAVPTCERLELGANNLRAMGFGVTLDPDAAQQHSRFGGTDQQRLDAIHRSLSQPSDVVMASRGGYGLTRLLPQIDWKAMAESGKRFVGHSDFTALNLGLLAQTGAPSLTGPNVSTDFGEVSPDPLMADLFGETLRHELQVLSFESEGSDDFDGRGVFWGGNLAMLVSLMGTPYFPQIRQGVLFVEDVNEHPYRVERMLLQLLHAGVLAQQQALVLGHFTEYRLSASDHGYDLQEVVAYIRQTARIPVIMGLPYGHVPMKATLPIGAEVGVATEDGMAYLLLDEHE